MNFIRRAWLFTKAKISRTILLIIAFTAILVFVLSGLIINSAANKSIANAKKDAGATITLSVNRQKIMQQVQNNSSNSDSDSRPTFTMPSISETTANKIAALNGIKSYSYTMQATADADSGITAITSSSNTTNSDNNQTGGRFSQMMQNSGDFQIIGTNNLSASSDFSNGTNTITSGRGIEASDENTNNVVIEKSLASSNNLIVGSTFTLKDSNNKTYKMKIVGIYKSTSSTSGLANNFSFMDPSNQMYTALSLPNKIEGKSGTITSAIFNLKNPAESSNFVKKATTAINNSNYEVQSNDAIYQQMLTPLNNVASFARNIVLIVAIAGAIILALIVMLMVRERRFEIGVLMSLGENKAKIVGQFFVELFMVMIVSVLIAVAAGNVVGNAVGQQLLKQETTSTQTTAMSGRQQGDFGGQGQGQENTNNNGMRQGGGMRDAFGFGQSTSERNKINKLNVKMNGTQIVILVAIAILITLVAVGLASIGILRLNPKQVLTN